MNDQSHVSGHEDDAESAVARRARALVRDRFLAQAQRAESQAEIDAELGPKMDRIAGRGGKVMTQLRRLGGQAGQLWQQREKLTPKQIALLGAGILYFISPLDAVSDLIPVLGYVDDVAVLTWILSQLIPAVDKLRDTAVEVKDSAVDEFSEQIVAKGRVALNELIDERSDELLEQVERTAQDSVEKAVTALVIGLWGTTMAAALSLALTTLAGGYTTPWLVYVLVSSVVVVGWNLGLALSFLRRFRELEAPWQRRIKAIAGARLGRRRHLLMVLAPALVLLAIAIAHALVH